MAHPTRETQFSETCQQESEGDDDNKYDDKTSL